MSKFYLLTDTKFLYCYLVDKWLKAFNQHPNFGGVLVRSQAVAPELEQAREQFHQNHQGISQLSASMDQQLQQLYPDFGEESRASIDLYGIPEQTFSHAKKVVYLGDNLNSEGAKAWVEQNLSGSSCWVFSHVGQILKPWWVAHTQGRLLNMHSAVLPYARGANAVQNVAALGDEQQFRQVAGATVHYIDAGIDTGQLIVARRLSDPFQYDSLWHLTAAIYDLGDSLYVETAQAIVNQPDSQAVGFSVCDAHQGPLFYRRDFTSERRDQAEQAYLMMRQNQA